MDPHVYNETFGLRARVRVWVVEMRRKEGPRCLAGFVLIYPLLTLSPIIFRSCSNFVYNVRGAVLGAEPRHCAVRASRAQGRVSPHRVFPKWKRLKSAREHIRLEEMTNRSDKDNKLFGCQVNSKIKNVGFPTTLQAKCQHSFSSSHPPLSTAPNVYVPHGIPTSILCKWGCTDLSNREPDMECSVQLTWGQDWQREGTRHKVEGVELGELAQPFK